MKIVVRTKTFPVFQMFFKSFLTFHKNRLNDLTVQVLVEGENIKFYESLQKKFCFKIVEINNLIENTGDKINWIHDNFWAHMIYESLQYDDVVSLDDDVIFLKPGFFEILEKLPKNEELFSFQYKMLNGETIMNSSCIYKRKNVKISKDEFTTLENIINIAEGVDTGLIHKYHDIIYLHKYINTVYIDE